MRPVMCMVTAPARGAAAESALIARASAAARAGVHLIQIRDRDADGGPLASLVARCVAAVAATTARVVVNDRLDVALAAGAHGVHLRGDSMPAARVRAITPRAFVVGRSVHGVEEAEQAEADGGLDYLIFGTTFRSASKPAREAAGTGMLADVVRRTALPVLAIGGVTPANVSGLAAAGAAGFAAIGLFADDDLDRLHLQVARASEAFDTPYGVT